MAAELRTEEIDRLVLVWLAMRATHEGKKRQPDPKSLEGAVRPHVKELGLSAEAIVRQSVGRLIATGDIHADTKWMLTDAGKKRALAALGVSKLPRPTSWKWVVERLLASGLGMEPSDANVKSLSGIEALAAAIVRKERKVDARASTPGKVANMIAWRALGVESVEPLTTKAVLTHVLRSSGWDGSLKKDASAIDVLRAIAARDLHTSPGAKSLQTALVARWMRGNSTAPSQAPAPETPTQPLPVVATELSLEDFAKEVLAAARASKTGRFGDRKVFISHVWAELKRTKSPAGGGDLAGFKDRLVRANQAGLVSLSRAELVQVMDPRDLAESVIEPLRVHFVRTD